jgi:large subunit ribosomal protein L31e
MKEENEKEQLTNKKEHEETIAPTEETESEEKTEEISKEEKEEEIAEEEVAETKTEEEVAETEAEEVTPVEEEEEARPPREEKAEEEEIVEERIYTIPLGKVWIVPPNKRAPRAVRMVRDFVTKHMKLEAKKEEEEEEAPAKLIISNEVNEGIWKRGIEKPPRKIRVRAAKDKEGNVTVYLAEGD